jgi:sugar/nucleoside kinase (ribokinase family)
MILSVGELLVDLVTQKPVSDLSEAEQMEVKPGGSPANFAAGCCKLGADVTLVASVGADGFGKMLLQFVNRLGIQSNHIHQLHHHATSVIVIGRNQQTPEFIAYRDADCQIPPIPLTLIQECRILHSTSFALSKSPAQYRILDAMQKASSSGKLVSADWNYSTQIWGADNDATSVFEQLMQYSPLLKLSMDDVQRFWGKDTDIQSAMNMVNRYATTAACITCGAEGVWYRLADGSWKHRNAKPVKVTDPTGAGDSFWSGFITSYLNNRDMDDCIDAALETASLKLQDKL